MAEENSSEIRIYALQAISNLERGERREESRWNVAFGGSSSSIIV